MKLKHKLRREGIIAVGSSRYTIDQNGEVEVPDEAAAAMLQGAMWSRVEGKALPKAAAKKTEVKKTEVKKKPEVKKPEEPQRLEQMSRDNLIMMAKKLGLKVDRNESKLKIAAAIKAAQKGK